MKRVFSVLLSFAVLMVSVFSSSAPAFAQAGRASAQASFNYGEALQKAIMFYEFQRSGELDGTERNNWRGNSGMTDGADAGLDLTGGYYDAGDHVKFNLPMSYTAATLAWDIYEYEDVLRQSGQLSYMKAAVKWVTDYLIKCNPSPNVFYYQVGSGSLDHSWWGPAEVMQMDRPSYKLDSNHPGSAVSGEAAAALAAASIVFRDSDPGYARTCLSHAEDLFQFADTTKSDAGYTAASGYYNSWSGFYDELSWSAVWLYLATDDETYLNKAESYVPNWGMEGQSGDIAYQYTQNWDDVHYGAELLLARITGKPVYKNAIEHCLDWWTTGYNGSRITYTPQGLAWLSQWGVLRYATTTAFLARLYADWPGCDNTRAETYRSFAKQQVDYALGSTGYSYEIGFGNQYPRHPHHRTAQGSWADNMNTPDYSRHTLYGALVGGPDSGDGFEDSVSSYTQCEPACDYNAGFVGALTQMFKDYGGEPIDGFRADESPSNTEFFVKAGVNAAGTNFEEIKALLYNESGWPARMGDRLSFLYFVDLSELENAGYGAGDVTLSVNYNNGATVTGLFPWDEENHIYYAKIDFTGTKIYPGGQSAYKKEVQFRMAYPGGVAWDNSNDFSYFGIASQPGSEPVLAAHIPVYDAETLVFGEEPDSSPGASISPSSAVFDRNPENQADIPVSVSLNGNTLSGIYSGTDELSAGSDYTVSDGGATVTILKEYLAGRTVGTLPLTFRFSAGRDAVLTVTVKDTTLSHDSAISPTEAGFDRYRPNQEDIPVAVSLNGNTLNGIYNGSSVLTAGTDYTVSEDGSLVTILSSYLEKQMTGVLNLAFDFSAGGDPVLKITVSDSSPAEEGSLKAEMYSGTTEMFTNGINPHIRLTNTGTDTVHLSDVTLRYYFIRDGAQSQKFWCDWSSAGTANVTGRFVSLSVPAETADNYLEIGFSGAAGTLAPDASVEIQARFSKDDWSNYDQSNDYSFRPNGGEYDAWTKVTVYLGDTLKWGIEP